MRRLLALPLALSLLVLSGCAEPKPEDVPALVDDGEFDGVQATQETGVIRGVVVDDTITPVAGALVSVLVDGQTRNATSADSGAFAFANLPPGTYFLQVGKLGYNAVQASVDVVAGVDDPPIVKVLLSLNPSLQPYFAVVNWNGFLECSMRVGAPMVGSVGVNACNGVGNQDVNFPLAPMDAVPDFLQAELLWDSTQVLGSGLSFVVGPPSCVDIKYARADGGSPQVIRMNQTLLLEESADALDDGFDPENGVCYRVFSWVADESQGTLGLVTSQQFRAFFHTFYNFVPEEGWQFSVDGDPVVPS